MNQASLVLETPFFDRLRATNLIKSQKHQWAGNVRVGLTPRFRTTPATESHSDAITKEKNALRLKPTNQNQVANDECPVAVPGVVFTVCNADLAFVIGP